MVLSFQSATAQSEAYAGGEILVRYAPQAGDQPCDALKRYEFLFKFYRDWFPTPFAATKTLALSTESSKGANNYGTGKNYTNPPLEITLNQIPNQSGITNGPPCIVGSPSSTQYQWYRAFAYIPQRSDWIVRYGIVPNPNPFNQPIVGVRFFSDGTENIERKTTFSPVAFFNNSCVDSKTDANGIPAKTMIEMPGTNTPAEWSDPHIVLPFCDGVRQEYKLRVIDTDITPVEFRVNDPTTKEHGTVTKIEQFTDRLVFELKATKKDGAGKQGRPVSYASGFSASVPLPVKPPNGIDVMEAMVLDSNSGVLSFTPDLSQLGPNISSFVGVITVVVRERRKYYKEVTVGGITELQLAERTIAETFRDIRVNIDANCNTTQPSFSGIDINGNLVTPTPQDANGRYIFDCANEEFDFEVSDPMFAGSIHKKDETPAFRMYRVDPNGDPLVSIDKNSYDLTVEALNPDIFGEFTRFRITTVNPIGPGNYSIITKRGDDGNTWINECGQEIAENLVIPIKVDTNFNYVFQGDDPIKICWDAQAAEINAFDGMSNADLNSNLNNTFLTRFSYRGPSFNAPIQFTDQQRKSDFGNNVGIYNFEHRFTDLSDFPEGWWTIEVVRNFPWTVKGSNVTNDEFCTDDDPRVFVESFDVPEVDLPDLELCPREDWPVIRTSDLNPLLAQATDFRWVFNQPQPASQGGGVKPIDVGGSSNSQLRNDTFDIKEVLGFGGGNGQQFEIGLGFTMNDCVVPPVFFKVRKEEVLVELERDSTICPGEQYDMTNQVTYNAPDLMTYQWFLNDKQLNNATSPTLKNSRRGEYKLVVTKTSSADSVCIGMDSLFVNVADSLLPPAVECSWVTFEDGTVIQRFFWPQQDGADLYQARGIDQNGDISDSIGFAIGTDTGGWVFANHPWGIQHTQKGQQMRLEVRAVNTEVDEEAICKYGPISLAEACNIEIKELNVFTPNGDGTNDLLRFDLLEVFPGSDLKIFNRWGELIYEDDDYSNDWDGGDYEEGVYYYLLDINDESQGLIKGTITLLR